MGEPAVPMNGHAPFARGPTKGRGVRLVRIPRPGAVPRLCLDPRAFAGIPRSSFPVEAIQPAASLRAAGLAGRRAGRAHHGAKGSEPPCGKVRPDHPTARPVDHRLTLDPCGLAYSLLRPPASTPKVVLARGWTTGLPRKRSPPEGPRLGRWTDYCGPAKAGSGRDGRRGKSRKGGAGVQARGAGRCSRPSLEYPLFVKHQKQPVGRRKQPFVRGASNDPIEPIAVIRPCCSECRCSKSDRPKPDLGPGKANYGLGRRSSHSSHSSCEAKGAALPFRVGTANSLRTAYLCCEPDQCLAIRDKIPK